MGKGSGWSWKTYATVLIVLGTAIVAASFLISPILASWISGWPWYNAIGVALLNLSLTVFGGALVARGVQIIYENVENVEKIRALLKWGSLAVIPFTGILYETAGIGVTMIIVTICVALFLWISMEEDEEATEA